MTSQSSKLIILEGPDGAGKSTILASLMGRLKKNKISVAQFSFPGKNRGTLGEWVYNVHHDPISKDIRPLTPAALQALHIAAHLDAIEQDIIPMLNKGVTVIMDRYWWSTWVYGTASGVSDITLGHLIHAEKSVWDRLLPDCAFLISRPSSFKMEAAAHWPSLSQLYRDIAAKESEFYPIHHIENIDTVDASVSKIIDYIYNSPK